MRATLVTAMALVAVLGGTAYVSAGNEERGQKGTVVGEVIDITNFAMKGFTGEAHVAEGTHHSTKGFPIGILEDETGDVYIAVYRNPAPASGLQPANELLTPLMGKKVAVQGMKYCVKGVNLMQISIISEY